MSKPILRAGAQFLSLFWMLGAPDAMAQPTQREFPVGKPQAIHELPASRFVTELEKLSPAARERARAWLGRFHFTEGDLPSLHTDAEGSICYACKFGHGHAAEESAPPEPESPSVSAAAVPVSPFPSSLVFNSRPGSVNVLYINFSGVNVTNTQWNTLLNRNSIPAVAFSTDSDYTTFSDSEQAIIKRIWQRMAEDFAPFNINVTTQPPSTFTSRTAVALITRKTDANGAANPYNNGGGVAYVDVFGRSDFATYSPAWIYHDNLNNNESLIAEAASHEIGHNLGLSHDGTGNSEYYGGHGSGEISWGPIMGTGYNQNVSQWSKGEYLNANNTQDDLAIIAGKIGYRPSDHGSTRGTATPLVITNGTTIVSTTPENDPSNTNPANKGVLEGNKDVDVFSFVTGSGPVQFTVRPWIGPGGTRGGNLDILLEIHNEAGVILASSNPPDATSATIQTNLAEGRYYLYVKNSGAGSPLTSPPSGYTFYGSLGQYFINGTISESTGFVVPPVAELQVTDLKKADQATHTFTVTYSDNVAINVATVDSNDLQVTGPGGYVQLAERVSINFNTNGTPRVATYSVKPSGGGNWLPSNNGSYNISMRPEQVADTEGAYVPAGDLGQFQVAIPVPVYSSNMDILGGWTLQPQWQHGVPNYTSGGPPGAFTGSKIIGYNLSGDYPNGLAMKYAESPLINASGTSSLTLSFRRWLGVRKNDTALIQASTNGVNWVNVWSSNNAVSDSSWQLVQYPLPAGMAGSSSLRLRWGLSSGGNGNQRTACGWNIDDVQVLGDGAIDSAPPTASMNVSPVSIGGSPSHSCSVTYTDETGVLLASLDSSDLQVSGPNGYSSPAGFTGADQSTNSLVITGTYSIPAPGGSWDPSDNGTYTVTLQDGSVQDTVGNLIPETVLGTFEVSISAASPGVLVITPQGNFTASEMMEGTFTPSSTTYTLVNNGDSTLNWSAGKTADWISLDKNGGTLAAGASTEVAVSINSNAQNLTAGNYEGTVSFINTSSGAGNDSRNVSLTIISPGLLTVTPVGGLDASGITGGTITPGSSTYTLTNNGGSALDWSAGKLVNWLSLTASSGNLAAGASTTVTVSINSEAAKLPPGVYEDDIHFTNTTDGKGDTSRKIRLEVLPAPSFASLGKDETGIFRMVIQGSPGMNVLLEASADLMLWVPLVIVQIGQDGTSAASDPESASLPNRFYRLSASP
jgi:hypothetical protein